MFFKYLDEGILVITPIIQLNLSKNKLRVNCLHKLQIFYFGLAAAVKFINH